MRGEKGRVMKLYQKTFIMFKLFYVRKKPTVNKQYATIAHSIPSLFLRTGYHSLWRWGTEGLPIFFSVVVDAFFLSVLGLEPFLSSNFHPASNFQLYRCSTSK